MFKTIWNAKGYLKAIIVIDIIGLISSLLPPFNILTTILWLVILTKDMNIINLDEYNEYLSKNNYILRDMLTVIKYKFVNEHEDKQNL